MSNARMAMPIASLRNVNRLALGQGRQIFHVEDEIAKLGINSMICVIRTELCPAGFGALP
jgi:hypothetical protein